MPVSFTRAEEHRLHELRALKEQTQSHTAHSSRSGVGVVSPQPQPASHADSSTPSATPTAANPAGKRHQRSQSSSSSLATAAARSGVAAAMWNADLDAELHVLETKYDAFISEGLATMREMASSSLNRLPNRGNLSGLGARGAALGVSVGVNLRRLWQRITEKHASPPSSLQRQGTRSSDGFDSEEASASLPSPPLTGTGHASVAMTTSGGIANDSFKLAWFLIAVSLVVSMFAMEHLVKGGMAAAPSDGAGVFDGLARHAVARAHLGQGLVGIICGVAWTLKGTSRFVSIAVTPIRLLATPALAGTSAVICWKERGVWQQVARGVLSMGSVADDVSAGSATSAPTTALAGDELASSLAPWLSAFTGEQLGALQPAPLAACVIGSLILLLASCRLSSLGIISICASSGPAVSSGGVNSSPAAAL